MYLDHVALLVPQAHGLGLHQLEEGHLRRDEPAEDVAEDDVVADGSGQHVLQQRRGRWLVNESVFE